MDSRNNVMLRKNKPYNGRNTTTMEAEYEKDQERINARRNRKQEMGEFRRVTTYGSSEEKYDLKSQVNQEAEIQLAFRDVRAREDCARERRENEGIEDHRQQMLDMQLNQEMDRKTKLRQIQEENRLAAMAKSSESLYRKVNEDRSDRTKLESNLYNYNPNVF